MNFKNNRLLYFLLTINILILCISLCINANEHKFDADDFFSFAGLVITSLSFLISSMFAYYAVNAYSEFRKIEEMVPQVLKVKDEFTSIERTHIKHLVDAIDFQINVCDEIIRGLTKNNKNEERVYIERKNKLYLIRARMAYIFHNMTSESKENLIRPLASIGDETDLTYLYSLKMSDNTNDNLRDLCQNIIDDILNRLPTVSSVSKK